MFIECLLHVRYCSSTRDAVILIDEVSAFTEILFNL